MLNSIVWPSEGNVGKTLRSHGVQSIASPVGEIAIDAAACIETRVDHIGIELGVLRDVFHEGIVVVTERQSFSAAKVKKNIAIDIDDMASLRLVVVNESVHFRGLLIGTDIVASQHRLIPASTHIGASCLSRRESSASAKVVHWTCQKVELSNYFAL